MSDTQRPTLQLRLKRFPLDRIRPGTSVMLIGMRETGKTVIVRDILWHNRDVPCGTIICGTDGPEAVYKQYKSVVPPNQHHDEYTKEITRSFALRQTSLRQPNFFVLDDCLYDSSWIHDKYIQYLLTERRSLQTLFIQTMQYAVGVPDRIRTAYDYVFIMRENMRTNRRRLFDQYASKLFPDFDVFCAVLNQVFDTNLRPNDGWYSCLVIDNSSDSPNIEDRVFYFTATRRPDLRLCSDEYWTSTTTVEPLPSIPLPIPADAVVTHSLRTRPFHLDRIRPDSNILIIGLTYSEKTALVRKILHNQRHLVPSGVVIHGLEETSPRYSDIVPAEQLHVDYNPDIITDLLNHQRQSLQQNELTAEPKFFVMDECVYDPRQLKDEALVHLNKHNRSYKLLVLLTLPYPTFLPPDAYQNIDYIFVFSTFQITHRRRLHEHYCYDIPFDVFCATMETYATNTSCLVIDNILPYPKPEDHFFHYTPSC